MVITIKLNDTECSLIKEALYGVQTDIQKTPVKRNEARILQNRIKYIQKAYKENNHV